MNKKIDHIGIAVKSIDEWIENIDKILKLKCTNIEKIEGQKVKIGMVPVEDINIELLESTHSDGPIAKFLEKKKEGFHHIAFKVENIEKELIRLKNENIKLIDEKYRIGAHGSKIAFIHPDSMNGLLVELVEEG